MVWVSEICWVLPILAMMRCLAGLCQYYQAHGFRAAKHCIQSITIWLTALYLKPCTHLCGMPSLFLNLFPFLYVNTLHFSQ